MTENLLKKRQSLSQKDIHFPTSSPEVTEEHQKSSNSHSDETTFHTWQK